MPATDLTTTPWHPESVARLTRSTSIHDSAEELGGLDFEDLPRHRVDPPPLPAALLDVHALRTQYQQARADYTQPARTSDHRRRARNAPSQPRDQRTAPARRRRPALPARTSKTSSPNGPTPKTEYDDARRAASNGRANSYAELQDQPDADPLDIASAKLDINWRIMACPRSPPAERYQPALHDAIAARANAAGGAEHIISGDDVDKLIAAEPRRRPAQCSPPAASCSQLRRDLDRAELAAAAAFAAAETRSADHITAQLDELDTELRVLEAASRYQPTGPSTMPPAPSPTCPPPPPQPSPGPPRCPSPSPSSTPHPHDERTARPCTPCTTPPQPPTEKSCGAAPPANRPTTALDDAPRRHRRHRHRNPRPDHQPANWRCTPGA